MKKLKFKNKKVIIVSLLVIILLAGSVFAIQYVKNDSDPNKDATSYSPPTIDEQEAADTQKERNIQRETADKSTDKPQTANLVIVDANQYSDTVEVRAYVSNIYEDGGKCVATFSNGSSTVQETSDSFKDATTTQCGAINVPVSKFPAKGSWQVKVNYSSQTVTGESEVKNISIQ